jgi:hypothetical protein
VVSCSKALGLLPLEPAGLHRGPARPGAGVRGGLGGRAGRRRLAGLDGGHCPVGSAGGCRVGRIASAPVTEGAPGRWVCTRPTLAGRCCWGGAARPGPWSPAACVCRSGVEDVGARRRSQRPQPAPAQLGRGRLVCPATLGKPGDRIGPPAALAQRGALEPLLGLGGVFLVQLVAGLGIVRRVDQRLDVPAGGQDEAVRPGFGGAGLLSVFQPRDARWRVKTTATIPVIRWGQQRTLRSGRQFFTVAMA